MMRSVLPQRDAAYVESIRAGGCQVPGCRHRCARVEHHHAKLYWLGVSEGGCGKKGSDYCGIGLCHEHHMELQHVLGDDAFELKYGLEINRLIVANLIRFIAATRRTEWL